MRSSRLQHIIRVPHLLPVSGGCGAASESVQIRPVGYSVRRCGRCGCVVPFLYEMSSAFVCVYFTHVELVDDSHLRITYNYILYGISLTN